MKIVHLSNKPISLAPLRLCRVQQLAGMDARFISVIDHYDLDCIMPTDLLIREDHELACHILEEADLIHYHNHWKDSMIFELYPHLWEVVAKKPSVIQFHSYRHDFFEPALSDPSLTKLVIAQYHVRFFPECTIVPNVVPIYDDLHSPSWTENDNPVVIFSPHKCNEVDNNGGWGNKGCKETLNVLENKFQYRFLTGKKWEKVMTERKNCDIAIDEVMTGSYHMCSLESLSQGLATIANLDTLTIDALEKITGTRKHPWIIASAETLEEKLNELIEDRAFLKSKRFESRKYMEKYWNPMDIGARFKDIYAKV